MLYNGCDMQLIARIIYVLALLVLPVVEADMLSYWEQQGIVNITFSEPVVTRTVVENQYEEGSSAADRGLDLFTISGDEAHPPRVLWVDQDSLRIEPSPGTSVKTEYCLRFKDGARYQSGRRLEQYEYRFRAPVSPLVHEDLRTQPNGAALISAQFQNTAEAAGLGKESGLSYTFTRLKMDARGDFFESGEKMRGVPEEAQLRHGYSYSVLRSLAKHGARWDELKQDSPLPGYVVVRAENPLPAGSIWRLNAKAPAGSGVADSNLGPIYVNRYLSASMEQSAETTEQGDTRTVIGLRFNSLVEKEQLQQAFREMELKLNGVPAALAEDGCTRTAVVEGRVLTVRYAGELPAPEYMIVPEDPEDFEFDALNTRNTLVRYAHPTAAPGMKLVVESDAPVLVECTLKAGLKGVLGLPLEGDFTCRYSVNPMQPALWGADSRQMSLHGSHVLQLGAMNGSRLKLRLRHWKAEQAAAALPHIRAHLDQQERRRAMGHARYERAVVQARIAAGLARPEELPALPENGERAWEVLHNRIFLQPAGGEVLRELEEVLPVEGNGLAREGRIHVDLGELAGGPLKPGIYLLETDLYPTAEAGEAARAMGMQPEELVQRRDWLVSVSDLSVIPLRSSAGGNELAVLRTSDASLVAEGSATMVSDEQSVTEPLRQGYVRLPAGEGEALVRSGEDYCIVPVSHVFEGSGGAAAEPELRAMLWTDRAVYRPGERVFVRGFLRAVCGRNQITQSKHRELELHFESPGGRRLFSRTFDVDEYGAFQQELTLPAGQDDVCGQYRIRVGTTRPRTLATHTISCQVFRRDAFELELQDQTARVCPEELVLAVKAQDFAGQPVGGARAELKLSCNAPLEGAREVEHGAYELVLSRNLAVDGVTVFRVPLGTLPQGQLRVHYGVSVANARQEYRQAELEAQYAGSWVRPELTQDNRVRLICSTCGKPLHASHSVRVALVAHRGQLRRMPNGFAYESHGDEEIWSQWFPVPADAEEGVPLDLEALCREHKLAPGSLVQVELKGRDVHGHVFQERFLRQVDAGQEVQDLKLEAAPQPGRVRLVAGQGGHALLAVSCGGGVRLAVQPVQRGEQVVELPLLPEDGGRVVVSAAMLSQHAGASLQVAHAQAELQLDLPRPQNELAVELALPGTVRPGTRQTISGRVCTPDGKPAQAVVTLYAVDAGMLSQTGYELPDVARSLSRWSVSPVRMQVPRLPDAGDELEFNTEPMSGLWQGEGRMRDGSWSHQPWWMRDDQHIQSFHTRSKGVYAPDSFRKRADGAVAVPAGDAQSRTEGLRVRSDFAPLALWRSALKTDADGRFSTTCTLPDTLTTYRVIAVAADKGGSRFGTREGEFTANQPVMLTPGAPLFMSVGDSLQLPVTITNNTTSDGSWQVQLVDGGEPQQVQLAPGASAVLHFEVSARQAGQQRFRWVATGATGEDAAEGTFEVRHPVPLLKEAHHLVLVPGQAALVPQEKLAAAVASAPGCELELLVSANPLLHLKGGVDFLLEQPGGFLTETGASALLPWLLYDRLAPLCPRMAQTPASEVKATVARAAARLLKFQNEDGGVPLFQRSGESCAWVSAHLAMVLRMAEERGFELPQRSWYNLLSYLEKTDMQQLSPLSRYAAARALQNRDAQREALKDALAAMPESQSGTSVRADIEFLEYLRTNNDGRHEAFLRWMRTRAADYRHHSSWSSAWSLYALMTYIGDSPGAQVEAALRLPDGSTASLNRSVYRVPGVQPSAAYTAQRGTVYALLRAQAQPVQTDYPGVTEHGLQMTRVYEKKGEDGVWRPVEQLVAGDVVRVSLTCAKAGEQELNHLVLDDYLPACLEAINPDVPGQAAGLDPLCWSDCFDHREFLADRVRGFCTRWSGRDAVNLRYYARVKYAGSATAPPAQAQLLYEPQTYGLSPSARLDVRAK